mmetsp:Transcript_28380/g.91500  ORF Transcript_28380/g.91500 Transcript_28380/m.91500 type:complete len:243 (-) Transcript_28380:135-863(-)
MVVVGAAAPGSVCGPGGDADDHGVFGDRRGDGDGSLINVEFADDALGRQQRRGHGARRQGKRRAKGGLRRLLDRRRRRVPDGDGPKARAGHLQGRPRTGDPATNDPGRTGTGRPSEPRAVPGGPQLRPLRPGPRRRRRDAGREVGRRRLLVASPQATERVDALHRPERLRRRRRHLPHGLRRRPRNIHLDAHRTHAKMHRPSHEVTGRPLQRRGRRHGQVRAERILANRQPPNQGRRPRSQA